MSFIASKLVICLVIAVCIALLFVEPTRAQRVSPIDEVDGSYIIHIFIDEDEHEEAYDSELDWDFGFDLDQSVILNTSLDSEIIFPDGIYGALFRSAIIRPARSQRSYEIEAGWYLVLSREGGNRNAATCRAFTSMIFDISDPEDARILDLMWPLSANISGDLTQTSCRDLLALYNYSFGRQVASSLFDQQLSLNSFTSGPYIVGTDGVRSIAFDLSRVPAGSICRRIHRYLRLVKDGGVHAWPDGVVHGRNRFERLTDAFAVGIGAFERMASVVMVLPPAEAQQELTSIC